MKNIIKYTLIFFLTIFLSGCENDDDTNSTGLGEAFVYFNIEDISVDRSKSEPVSVELRYEGPETDKDIEVLYTVNYPSENNAVEGADFILPKTGSFIIRKGKAISNVVLLQRVNDNEDAIQPRSLSIELQPKEGITIGNSSNFGSSINITLGTDNSSIVSEAPFIGEKKFSIVSGTSKVKIPYFSNREDIRDVNNDAIRRAIIVLHGSEHTAGKHYTRMMETAEMESNNLDTLLVVSPQFIGEEEIDQYTLDSEHSYWSGNWRIGNTSLDETTNPRTERVSSFTFMDSLMIKLSEYPNLKTIVLTGHSAGGQYINRYAAGSPIPDELNARGVDVSFIVNNPKTYVYMDNKRKVPGTENTFEVPSGVIIGQCPEYNEYRFGLDDLPTYLDAIGENVIRNRLPQRKVTYLVGQNDVDTDIDTSNICEAQLQGKNRFDRAHNYFDHLLDYYGPSIMDTQKMGVVIGVGHSSEGMYKSERGRKNTFRN
ncbi:hypothetical protein [Aquimarina algiphila]|uniref:hypothetical protein n=1 Tax=Aquimarina algiphila TaxID=2047982 RepID=UPI00232C6B80|nr:hypothetical protein [Aquimarina algiphila]